MLKKFVLCSLGCFFFNLVSELKLGDSFSSLNVSLNDWRGNPVTLGSLTVFEWTNFSCPYVQKHYGSGNMQRYQQSYKGKVTWVTVNSSRKGREGYLEDNEIEKTLKEKNWNGDFFVKDSNGLLGRAFGAKTTPHIFIFKEGILIYKGAIDSIPSTKPGDIEIAENYIKKVVDGAYLPDFKPFETKAYGCSVKY
ncbi:MAG: thioredoxin family protein [Deltaproteobacteria bacterium]|nr:thioredoxin family protein [Deltaproteobacteria bacterium]